jgi:hypothetical protein
VVLGEALPPQLARRVVEEGQEDAAADEAVVLEENLSDEDEEADVATSCILSIAAVSRLNRYINKFEISGI